MLATLEQLVIIQPQIAPRPPKRVWTYQDFLDLPDDGKRYEIIKGELYMSNAPSSAHQFAVVQLTIHLGSFVLTNNLGMVLVAPYEVHLSNDTRPVQPDILFIKTERQPQFGSKFFTGAPDLIVEVISPSSVRLDRHKKFAAYEEAGVSEYWLVDPKARLVEVYTLVDGEYSLLGQFVDDEVMQSQLLAGFSLVVQRLFMSKG